MNDNIVNSIICGDAYEVLQSIDSDSVDIVLTSPPYNFGMEYDEYEDTKNFDDYFNVLFKILDECIRVLKFGGRLIINIQPLFSSCIPTHHIISGYLRNHQLIWKGEIIWDKNHYNCKVCSWGSWRSPSMPYLKYTNEFIEIFCKGSLKHDGSSSDITITADEFKDWVVAKWDIAPERDMKEYGHPAMFPEELVERCLKLFSYRNDIILDPFNGAGTTTYVAKLLDRKYIGIDISEKYCDVAKCRLNSIPNKLF